MPRSYTYTNRKLSIEQLLIRVTIDPKTGILIWKKRYPETPLRAVWNRLHAGKPLHLYYNRDGYAMVRLDHRGYLAHRLVWALVTGSWPAGVIDHLNFNKADNRFDNLRDIPRRINAGRMPPDYQERRRTARLRRQVLARLHAGAPGYTLPGGVEYLARDLRLISEMMSINK